ncbi:MAG: redoxin domain-containing protein [Planctomycetota bacterium]
MKRLLIGVVALCVMVAFAIMSNALFAKYRHHRRLLKMHAGLPAPLDRRIQDPGSLRDVHGKPRSLASLADDNGLVLVFLGTECPVSALQLNVLLEIEEVFRRRGLNFVAVFPNEDDTADLIAAYMLDREMPLLACKDLGQTLTRALGVVQTPTACILDREQVLRYRGRIDDSFGGAMLAEGTSRSDLRDALREVLENKWVSIAVADGEGRSVKFRSPQASSMQLTFAADVAPLMQRHCQGCHRPGRSAPFPLLAYEDVRPRVARIAEMVAMRTMPPWNVDDRYGEFANCRRLDDRERETILAWIEEGAPRGEKKSAPKPIAWPGRWSIGVPDVVIEVSQPLAVDATGPESLRSLAVDAGTTNIVFSEDRWVRSAEVLPTNADVTRRIDVAIFPADDATQPARSGKDAGPFAWLPGGPTYRFPEGMGYRVPMHSRLAFEVHHKPNGVATEDRPAIGLLFAKRLPEKELVFLSRNIDERTIPRQDPHHREEFEFSLNGPRRLVGLMGSMGLRGKAYRVERLEPNGHRETLLRVPRFDVNVQDFYWLASPKDLGEGSRLVVTGWWDNSQNNLNNPNAKATIKLGPASVHESLSIFLFLEKETP